MKVALLGNAESIHCIRWVNGLIDRGLEVVMISAHSEGRGLNPKVDLRLLSSKPPLGYITGINELSSILNETQPDLINAHYATGYGLMARFARRRPLMLSVWGADVYDFPAKSPIHKWLLRGNLQAADVIGSTSHCMARQTRRIGTDRHIYITPFGVDTQLFSPAPKPLGVMNQIVIGTVKTLSYKYGIDILIQAFAQVWVELGQPNKLRLEIAGEGVDQTMLMKLCEHLGIKSQVHFHGKVSHEEVPALINRMDIFVALSRLDSESFGVAVVEAAACGKPVLVSDAEGLAEVTDDGISGIVVPKNNPKAAALALRKLIDNKEMQLKMGKAGRQRVEREYSWEKSLDLMLQAYHQTLAQHQ